MRQSVQLWDRWQVNDTGNLESSSDWHDVALPHDYAISQPLDSSMQWGVDQAFRNARRLVWYRRHITIGQLQAHTRYVLMSDGMYENARVYVNGHEAGGQAYGYSPFEIDMTQYLQPGDNELLIRLDTREVPTDRWYSGVGIYRSVTMQLRPENYVDSRDLVVTSDVDVSRKTAKVLCRVDSDELSRQQRYARELYRVEVCDDQGAVVASAKGSLVDGIECELSSVKLWSAETPTLYTLRVETEGDDETRDSVCQRIGLRTIEFNAEQGMLVNGEKTIFRGVCVHQDGGAIGSATTAELWRKRLSILKSMGCNGLRLAHHMHPRWMLDLADEMGFYVYSEPFDKWQSGHYKRFFDAGWKNDLDAMLRRDRNRPSVVMWGVGNEVENQAHQSMLAILRMLVSEAHRLDHTRPVGCALSPHFSKEAAEQGSNEGVIQATDEKVVQEEITDPAERVEQIAKVAALSDIVVLNYAEQWYDAIHQAVPDKPLFGSEVYQYFQGHELQMQDYREDNPNLVPLRKPYVIGGAVWAGFDYLGESMGWPSQGWSGALIRTNNSVKAGYWLLRSYWTDKPFVRFMVADYTQPDENVKEHWDIPPFVHHWEFPHIHKAVVPYAIATNCDEVRIWVNEREIYPLAVAHFANRLITGYLPYQAGKLTIVGLKQGKEVTREVISTPGQAQALQFITSDEKEMPISTSTVDEERLNPSQNRLQVVTVRAVDGEGNPVFHCSERVTFSVEGDVQIIAVDNGNLMNTEGFQGNQVHLWQGKASCIIRIPSRLSHARVYAHAEGFESAALTIEENK